MGAINFDLNFWTLSLLVLNFILALFVAVSNRSKAANDELKAVKASLHADIVVVSQQVAAQGQRLAGIEAEVENSINKNDIIVVHKRIDAILKSVGPIEGQLAEMSKSMDRIHNELLQILRTNYKR